MHEDFQVGITALETGEDLGEEVGTHHRWDTNLDGALLQLFVIVDFQHGVLDIAERQFYAIEKDGTFRRQGQLLLTAIKELDAQFGL